MPQTDDSTQDYRSKISYPQLSGNVSGTVSNSGITVAPTPAVSPTPSAPTAGSIPSSFSQPQLMAPASTGGSGSSGGSGSGGGTGSFDAKPELRVNIQRPTDLSTGKPATEPPPGSNVVNPYAVTQPPAPDMGNTDWGKAGTRNEGIYPDKRSDAGNTMVADNSAPRRFIAGQEQSAADAAATWGSDKATPSNADTAVQGLTREERAARTQKTNQGPTDPALRKRMGLPPLAFGDTAYPILAANSAGGTMSDAAPPEAGTVAPAAIQPAPLGVRAAQSLKSGVGTAMDAVGAANDVASLPGKVVRNAAGQVVNAAGTVASDFGKEMLNLGGSQILPPGSPAAVAAAAPAKNPNAVNADSPAPGQWPPLKKAPVAQPVPALLGGNGIMDKPLVAPGALMTPPPQGGIQTPPGGPQAPVLQSSGPLPKLEAKDNQSIFEAMVNLGNGIAQYRSNVAGNALVQQNFKNMLESSKYNMDNLSKMTEVQSKFSDEQRKVFDQQLKSRTAEAVRQLALGPKSAANPKGYDPNNASGLRILAGMEKTQDVWKPHDVLIPRAPGQEMYPQEKVTVFENTKTGAIVPFNYGSVQGGNTVTRAQADQMKTQGKMSDAQLADYLKKNGKTIAGN